MPTAFVAGATGYTGREVVRALRARGVRTIAHVRPDSSRLSEWQERFGDNGAEVDTTPWDAAAMAETFRRLQPTHVFALLGTTQARAREARRHGADAEALSYEAVDYGMTAILIDAAAQAGTRPTFVYLSALGVSASAPGGYIQARWKAEEKLRSSGLPFVIARPAFISGPDRDERRPMERVAARAVDGILSGVAFLGGKTLSDRYRSMTGAELAQSLVQAAFDPGKLGRVLDPAALRA